MPGAGQVRAGRAYVELGVDDRMAAGLARAQRRLRAFGAQVQAVGMGLMKLGALVAAPLALGVKAYADFEQQMANVATMLDEPGHHMERFKAGIRSMAVEFGESTDALAGGLYDILSASIAPAEALDVLTAAVKAAKAGMTDTKVAADAITTVLNSYGLSADKAADVSDWLFAVVKRGKTTFAELAPCIGLVASTASTAGVSLEELGAMTALLTRSGIRTENAITAINATIMAFLKPTDDAAKYARSLGFELSTATIQAEGIRGVFERIANLPPEAVTKLFPNLRAIRGVLPALAHLDEFATDMEQMTGRAGRTEDAYEKMAATLMHSFRRIKQAAVVAFGEIGEALADSVEDATEKILKVIKATRDWLKENKELIPKIAKLALKVVAVGAALWAIGGALKAAAIALGVVKGAVIALHAAMMLMAMNPLVAVGLGLAMVTAGLGLATDAARVFGIELGLLERRFDRYLDKSDEARKLELARLDRLKQLAELQERPLDELHPGPRGLTAAEIAEARELAEKLMAAHPTAVGLPIPGEAEQEYLVTMDIDVDRVTGEIRGLAQAEKLLLIDLQKDATAGVARAMDIIDSQIAELQGKLNKVAPSWLPEGLRNVFFFSEEEQRGFRERIEALNEEKKALDARREAIEAADRAALVGAKDAELAQLGRTLAMQEAADAAAEEAERIKQEFDAMFERLGAGARMVPSRGTFNPLAAQGLQTSWQRPIVDAIKRLTAEEIEQKRIQKQLLREAARSGLFV